jgi:hypothetical protein
MMGLYDFMNNNSDAVMSAKTRGLILVTGCIYWDPLSLAGAL